MHLCGRISARHAVLLVCKVFLSFLLVQICKWSRKKLRNTFRNDAVQFVPTTKCWFKMHQLRKTESFKWGRNLMQSYCVALCYITQVFLFLIIYFAAAWRRERSIHLFVYFFSNAHTCTHNESLIDSPAWPSFDIWPVCMNWGHEVKSQRSTSPGKSVFFSLLLHT